MYKYYMPKKINSNLQGMNSLIRIYNKLLTIDDDEIILNFKNTFWLSGEMVALFGAIAYKLNKYFNKKIYIADFSQEIEKVFKSNGFCEVITNMKNEEAKEFAVRFKQFEKQLNTGDTNCFNEYLKNEFSPKLELDKKEIDYISSYLSELFINARTHGETNEIFCCGQKYKSQSKIKFVIVDLGIGIPTNVRRIKKLDDCNSIAWSVEKGNTTKDLNKDTGGLGLADVIEFIEQHNGDISIISLKGEYNYRMNITDNLPYEFQGTSIYIDFDFNMLNNVDKMFEIIRRGKNDWDF